MLFCSIKCFSGGVLFYYMFQWWCVVLLHVSVAVFCSTVCFCCFVLSHVSVVVFCSIKSFSDVFFVLLYVSVLLFCFISCFIGGVLFYSMSRSSFFLFYYMFQW